MSPGEGRDRNQEQQRHTNGNPKRAPVDDPLHCSLPTPPDIGAYRDVARNRGCETPRIRQKQRLLEVDERAYVV